MHLGQIKLPHSYPENPRKIFVVQNSSQQLTLEDDEEDLGVEFQGLAIAGTSKGSILAPRLPLTRPTDSFFNERNTLLYDHNLFPLSSFFCK